MEDLEVEAEMRKSSCKVMAKSSLTRHPNRFSRDRPRFVDMLDVIKFLCKDLWTLVFRKQIDNLKTNHRVCPSDPPLYPPFPGTFYLLLSYSAQSYVYDTNLLLLYQTGSLRPNR